MYQSQADKYLTQILDLGLFKSAQAKAIGIPQSSLSWLVSKGKVIKIGPDVYHHQDIDIPMEEEEFSAACVTFGKRAAIGGASALFYYNLIEQIPNQVWVLVNPATTTHNKKYKLIRSKSSLEIGINSHEWFRITSIERAIIDAFRFQSKIGGIEMAIKAARVAIKENNVTPKNLLHMAQKLEWEKQFLNYWEAITIE